MSAVETSDVTATNATATNATATNATAAEDVFFPPAPSPPSREHHRPRRGVVPGERHGAAARMGAQPAAGAPPGGYEPPSPIAPPLPPYATPASPPPPPAPPDITLNPTYPPSPPPPMYLVRPCEDAAPPPPADTTLFGLFDYADATHQLYAALLALAALFLCFRARAKRFVKRLAASPRAVVRAGGEAAREPEEGEGGVRRHGGAAQGGDG